MAGQGAVYIGIRGDVLALDPATGTEIWRTSVKGASFVNVALVDDKLYAATGGEMFALDTATGQILWNNKLKGLGMGLVGVPPENRSTRGQARPRNRLPSPDSESPGLPPTRAILTSIPTPIEARISAAVRSTIAGLRRATVRLVSSASTCSTFVRSSRPRRQRPPTAGKRVGRR